MIYYFLPFAIFIIFLVLISYINMLFNYIRGVKIVLGNGKAKITKTISQAPGPVPWPIIGNLGLLSQYQVPFEGFTMLVKEFGDAYCLTLGSKRCLVVNNLSLIREVLNQNGKFFGGRPDFLRYHKLFGGDRNNSLALCDWSRLQQKRRNLARRHCSPKECSAYYSKMSYIGCLETKELLSKLKEIIKPGEPLHIKQILQQSCANMFSQYMCSIRFDFEDIAFQEIVENFDEIFWEINQGYAVDFLPWLQIFYSSHLKKITRWSTKIRAFILKRIIDNREQSINLDSAENDFTDALLKSLLDDKNVSRETILFMLEDFIGGHSAVGNLVMLCLTYIAKFPHIGRKIQAEVDCITQQGKRGVDLYDMEAMPYTMATIFEVLRYSSSPIVPHVATEDTVVSGYGVTSGTIVFINNYLLNTSEKYWTQPEVFDPTRFLETSLKNAPFERKKTARRPSDTSDSGVELERDFDVRKSIFKLKTNIPHFLPFSIGKRTCIGQSLVRGFSFILLANILQSYNICIKDVFSIKISPASIALPPKTFPLLLMPRVMKY